MELKKFGILLCYVLWQKHVNTNDRRDLVWEEAGSSMGVVELPRKHFASFRFDSELSGYRRYRTLVAGCKSNSLFSLSLSLSLSLCLSLSRNYGIPSSPYDKRWQKDERNRSWWWQGLWPLMASMWALSLALAAACPDSKEQTWLSRLCLQHQLLAWLLLGASPAKLIRNSTTGALHIQCSTSNSLLLVDWRDTFVQKPRIANTYIALPMKKFLHCFKSLI